MVHQTPRALPRHRYYRTASGAFTVRARRAMPKVRKRARAHHGGGSRHRPRPFVYLHRPSGLGGKVVHVIHAVLTNNEERVIRAALDEFIERHRKAYGDD